MAKRSARNSKKNGNPADLQASESKQNLVPINLDDEIRRRAYEIFEERRGAPGDEREDWLRAEREVLGRYNQQSA
jgi:hypothetical protein